MGAGLVKLAGVLRMIGWLSPAAVGKLAASIRTYGVNLLALLHLSANMHGSKAALADERETVTYRELFGRAEALSAALREAYGLSPGRKAGLLCRNHVSCVTFLAAVSGTGADLVLLNPDLGAGQLSGMLDKHGFDLLIADRDCLPQAAATSCSGAVLWSDDAARLADGRSGAGSRSGRKNRRTSTGSLVLLTGGTTGEAKTAAHKPSLFRYLDGFADFVSRLRVLHHANAYVATPLYHGYGLAVLLLFLAVGKTVVLRRRFDADEACRLIRGHRIEFVTVVPLMLHRMLDADPEALQSLRCIASGGAELSPKLAMKTECRLGEVLYNLYGTSETGLNMIAGPRELSRAPGTIGTPVKGVKVKIVDDGGKEVGIGQVGHLLVKSKGAGASGVNAWVKTGDLARRDESGLYFWSGRADDMIISGGENVYPRDVERVILEHPAVADAAVVGVADEPYGERLKAFVQPEADVQVTPAELADWLRPRLARFQMPREIVLVDRLPHTPLGKLDRKALIGLAASPAAAPPKNS
jgi:acyl-CoA synthetase (AMP-forming)/AMP-acid ligase II